MVRSKGADQVIEYTQEDFTKREQRYAPLLDVMAYRSIFDYKRVLSPKGIFVKAGGSMAAIFQAVFLGPWISMTRSKKMGKPSARPNQKDMVFMKELLEADKVIPGIDRPYSLSEVAEAIRYLG
jgi:NADPH:quinone reductase-like Zn-dependent oxidoreductase